MKKVLTLAFGLYFSVSQAQYCADANLLVNGGGEAALTGWTFSTGSGNTLAISSTVSQGASCFISSYNWSTKNQTVDLLAAGYSRSFLNTSPDIFVGEDFIGSSPAFNDQYYFKVVLKDSLNNVIASYNYGSTGSPITTTSSIQTASYTFANYPSGVKYLYFETGGNDVEYWGGNYGTRMDNAKAFIIGGPGLVKNGNAGQGLTKWTFTNGGNGWGTSTGTYGAEFRTSYNWSSKTQTIDLFANGYSDDELNLQPAIFVREFFRGTPNFGHPTYPITDDYYFRVELRNSSNALMTAFDYGTQASPMLITANSWGEVKNTFSGYGTDLRYIVITSGGRDKGGWAGHYGPVIDETFVGIGRENSGTALSLPATVNSICLGSPITTTAGMSSYFWTPTNSNTNSVNVSSSGTYTVGAVNDYSCYSSASTNVVTVNALPTVNLGTDQTACAGQTINFDAGAGMSAYSWNTGATTQNLAVSTSGTYTVTVTNSNGCSNSDNVIATFNAAVTVNAGADQTVCAGTGVTFNSGAGYSTYSWDSGETTQTLNTNVAGDHIITVTDALGCSAKDTVELINHQNPILFPEPADICNSSGPIALVSASPAGGDYTGAGVTGTNPNYFFNASFFPTGGTASISYSITDGNGCPFTTIQDYLVSVPTGTAGAISGDPSVCVNTDGNIYSVSTINNATSYNWILPSGATISGNSDTNIVSIDFSPSAVAGNITVTGSNACGSGTSSPALFISVNDVPVDATNLTGNTSFCEGSNNIAFSSDIITGATDYTWILPNGGSINTGANTNSITANFTNPSMGGYLYVSGSNFCGEGEADSLLLDINQFPEAAGLISGTNTITICPATNGVEFSIFPIDNATSYNWSLPSGATFSGNDDNDTVFVNFGSSSVSGNITVFGGNSCGLGNTSSLLINVLTVPQTEVCLATVDSADADHNVIIWTKDFSPNIDSFFIYREITTNNYQKVGAVHSDSLSEFHDYGADPNVTGFRYKIAAVDSCGNESTLGDYHNTIHLQYLGSGNFQWSAYAIQNQSNPVTSYNIYRDDLGIGNFQSIGTVPGSQTTFTDVNHASFTNALYRVDVDWSISCEATRVGVNTSRSNVKNAPGIIGGVNEGLQNLFKIYPNPAIDYLTIENAFGLEISSIEILDATGRIVLNYADTDNLDISGLSSGIYQIRIDTEKGIASYKIVKN